MKLETIVEWCVLVSKHVLCLWKGDGRDIVKAMFNSWSLARDVTPLHDLAPSNNTFLPALGLASRRAKRIPRAPRSHNLFATRGSMALLWSAESFCSSTVHLAYPLRNATQSLSLSLTVQICRLLKTISGVDTL